MQINGEIITLSHAARRMGIYGSEATKLLQSGSLALVTRAGNAKMVSAADVAALRAEWDEFLAKHGDDLITFREAKPVMGSHRAASILSGITPAIRAYGRNYYWRKDIDAARRDLLAQKADEPASEPAKTAPASAANPCIKSPSAARYVEALKAEFEAAKIQVRDAKSRCDALAYAIARITGETLK